MRRRFLRGWVEAHSETFRHYRDALDELGRSGPGTAGSAAKEAALYQGRMRFHAAHALKFRAELEGDEVLAYAADLVGRATSRKADKRSSSRRTLVELDALRAWDAYAYLGDKGVIPKRKGRARADHAAHAAAQLGWEPSRFQKARREVQPNPLRDIWECELERHELEKRGALAEEWAERDGRRFHRLRRY